MWSLENNLKGAVAKYLRWSHHLYRMKEYDLLRSSVNARTPFSFPGHSVKLRNCYIRFKTNEKSEVFLISPAEKLLHRFQTNEKSGVFLITLTEKLLHPLPD